MTALPIPTPTHEFELFTVSEIARLWKMDKAKLYRMVQAGEIKGIHVGEKSVRLHPEDIREYVNSLRDSG